MKKIFLLLFLLVVFSCKNDNNIPVGILSEDKMRDILIKIHIAEGKVSILNMREDSSKVLFYKLSNVIYQQHGTDSLHFKKSYNYYSHQPEMMEKIYTSVVDSLSLRESRKIIN